MISPRFFQSSITVRRDSNTWTALSSDGRNILRYALAPLGNTKVGTPKTPWSSTALVWLSPNSSTICRSARSFWNRTMSKPLLLATSMIAVGSDIFFRRSWEAFNSSIWKAPKGFEPCLLAACPAFIAVRPILGESSTCFQAFHSGPSSLFACARRKGLQSTSRLSP